MKTNLINVFIIFSTFCLTDKNSKCIAVNLYNLAPGKGVIIGDSVAIAEPFFSTVNLDIKDQVSTLKKCFILQVVKYKKSIIHIDFNTRER